jgi:hypothetical protein
MESVRYLYPFRKRVEIVAALYAGGFGMYILLCNLLGYPSPIFWLSEVNQSSLAHFMILASLIHSTGVSVNGAWRFSPALRVLGLSMHSTVIGLFVYEGNFSSASYTYGWILMALLYGMLSAIRDLYRSLGWDKEWNS